jgi:hypothetical protein
MDAILSGALAGAVGYTITIPLDFLKQHLQSASTTTPAIYQTIQKNGYKVLFRGGLVGLSSITPQMALKYYAFHDLERRGASKYQSAFGAGLIDGAFLGPILAIQSFKQMNLENRKISYADIVRKNVGSLMVPMALRNAVYTGTILGGYFSVRPEHRLFAKSKFAEDFIIGSVLNIPATILCSPFDVIRARHTHNLLNNRSISLGGVVKEIINNNGFKGFYSGYSSLYINFAIRFPLTLALQFQIMDFFIGKT